MSSFSNFWGQPNLPFGRSSGELIIELSNRSAPPPPPYELLQATTDTVWQDRMRLLLKHLGRYSWSLYERIYVAFAVLLSVVAPWPIMFLLNRAIAGNVFRDEDENTEIDDEGRTRTVLSDSDVASLAKARAASFGVLIGLYLLFWGPYVLFKSIATRRRRALLESFTAQDCDQSRSPDTHLIWQVRSISTYWQRAQVVVKLPMGIKQGGNPNPSSFAPGAPLPMYVAYPGPMDNGGYMDEKVGLEAPPAQLPVSYPAPQGPPPSSTMGPKPTSTLNRQGSNGSTGSRSSRGSRGSNGSRQLYAPPAGPPPPGARADDRV